MQEYRPETYGDRIADIYDELFSGITDAPATVAFLDSLVADRPGRILELAVGTGRLAIPLAERGHDVTGIDVSKEMLDRLRLADTHQRVTVVHGDMVDDLPAGPFDLVYVAFNSLFMLTEPARQRACFTAVARVLAPAGAFVVEAFVPWDPPRGGSHFEVRSMSATRVVLAANVTDPDRQTVHGQFIELSDGAPVRLRPYELRWSRPAELDEWATGAGLRLAERFAAADRSEFTDDSPFHLSVYRPASPTLRDLDAPLR
jgi:SAM-dependent methyltransferase